jgi:hypothetical protein
VSQLRGALQKPQEWQQHAGEQRRPPSPGHVLVLLAADVQAGRAAAFAAAGAGFPRWAGRRAGGRVVADGAQPTPAHALCTCCGRQLQCTALKRVGCPARRACSTSTSSSLQGQ